MKRAKQGLMFICLVVSLIALPGQALSSTFEPEEVKCRMQTRFTNINFFINNFDILANGKVVMASSLDARDVDSVSIALILQKNVAGEWHNVKSWSAKDNGTYCSLEENYYVSSGYQYRMVANGYVHQEGIVVESTSYISDSVLY